MGIFDKLREIFNGNENQQSAQIQNPNDDYEKAKLSEKIVELVRRISIKDSFNSKIHSLYNVSAAQLKTKDLDELDRIYLGLKNELSVIEQRSQSQMNNSRSQELEAAKWTGNKPKHMTDHEYDWSQR